MAGLCFLAAAAFAVYLILPDSPPSEGLLKGESSASDSVDSSRTGPGAAGKRSSSGGQSGRPREGRPSSTSVARSGLELIDIGNMGTPGDFELTDGAILMKSSAGKNQKGKSLNPKFDTGSLVGLRTRGDFVFQARLQLLSGGAAETGRAGLMVRSMMQGKARMVSLMITRDG